MVNVRVSKSFDFEHKTIKQAILESEKKLKSKGRLLVRPSGTEPVIRIMAESPDEAMVVTEINKLSDNKPSKSILNKFEFLPGTWNSMPKRNYLKPDDTELSNFYFDPIIIHLAGMRRKNRINFIKKYNKLFVK